MVHRYVAPRQRVIAIVQLVPEHDNVAGQAEDAGIEPERLDDSRRLTIVFMISTSAVVGNVHDVTEGEAYLEQQGERNEALEVGRHGEDEDDCHDHGRQHVVEELVEGSQLQVVAVILVPSRLLHLHFQI